MVKFMNFFRFSLALKIWMFTCSVILVLYLSSEVHANENTSKEDMEKITVSAKGGDLALQSFNSGDFSLAEIKFKDNVECALRAEMNQADLFESMQNQQVNQEIPAISTPIPQNSNPSNVSVNPTISFTPSAVGLGQQSNVTIRARTCENRGFQVYMLGMSQLQLGRSEEAEENLEQAIKIDKHLYDAQYRLALIKLLRKNKEEATEHLTAIKATLRKCNNYNCDFRQKIEGNLKFLSHALDGKIKLN